MSAVHDNQRYLPAVDHDERYALGLLLGRWLTLTLLYWLAAGIYFVWCGSSAQALLWVWVIASVSLWVVVGAVYVYVRLASLKESRRKSIM
jgi:hypothetical protein